MAERARTVMVQGTMSNAGKSMLVAALCRILVRQGLRVAPFKAQNMSLNSYATPDGGEIGRAQAVQAEAAMTAPLVQMNPILLKPEAERRSQVMVLGKATGTVSAREYYQQKPRLWPIVAEALDWLRTQFDVVVIEGAGSPAEINLRAHEIVNMRVARHASAPVLLVGDIDRGGVFASLVGTMELLEPEERGLVKGFIINKFRGDPSLLDSGLDMLLRRTGVPTLGVLPYFTDIHIPEEDSLGLPKTPSPSPRGERLLTRAPLWGERAPPWGEGEGRDGGALDIAVIRLPRMANFDDFDPLRREPCVRLRYCAHAGELGRPDLVIIPGSKTTMEDLRWLEAAGLRQAIRERGAAGTPVIGICAGYQMLGERVLDPNGVESSQREATGLGLLPVTTVFHGTKSTVQTEARVTGNRGLLAGCKGMLARGYEIHMGRTDIGPARAPFHVLRRSGRPVEDGEDADGALDAAGKTLGTYMHGLFHNGPLRRGLLSNLAAWKGMPSLSFAPDMDSNTELDRLAGLVQAHLDMPALYRATGLTDLVR